MSSLGISNAPRPPADTAARAPAREIDALAAEIDGLAAAAAGCATQIGPGLAELARRLRLPRLGVAFLGRFSSGKSSLINCALGRRLMPVSDIAETGVVCALHKGPRDRLTVHRRGGETLEAVCSSDALARFVSLRTSTGTANAELEGVEAIDIELEDFPGAATIWLDAPGMDNGDEALRAEAIVGRADVIVWTLGAAAFLSEVEAAAIARQVRRSGAGSVVLAINVFLKPGAEPAQRWREMQATHLPTWRLRMTEQAQDVGLGADWSPRTVVVSAEAAAAEPDGFGGPELRELLADFDRPETAGQVRMARAAHELAAAAEALQARLDEIAARNATLREALTRQAAGDAARRASRARFVREALAIYQARFSEAARPAAEALARQIQPPPKRDGSQARALNAGLNEVAGVARIELVQRLRGLEGGDVWGGPAAEAALARALETAPVEVTVPNIGTRLDGTGALIGGAIGLAIGLLLLGPGGLILGFFAALAGGYIAGARKAARQVVEGARANLLAASRMAAERMGAATAAAVEPVLDDCVDARAELPAPDAAAEDALRALVARTRAILRRLEERA